MENKKNKKEGEFVEIRDMEETPLLDALLDSDNTSPIVLNGPEGEIQLEQIAVIPHDEKIYAVLHPLTPMEGIEEDSCIVLRYEQTDEGETMVLEEDDEIVDIVYNTYLDLLND